MNKKDLTLIEVLNLSKEYLSNCKIENSRLEVEIFLADLYQINRLDLYLNFDKPVTEQELAKVRNFLKQKKAQKPLQYIMKKTNFYGLDLYVDESVLIPRFDTEFLVEQTLEQIKQKSSDQNIRILDIGTGSGAIAIALAAKLENLKITAIDKYQNALKVANLNIKNHQLSDRINLLQIDLFNNQDLAKIDSKFDLIISNPPYISMAEYQNLDATVKKFEPKEALTDSENGLKFYHRIKELLPRFLKQNGLLFLEIGYNQRESILKIYENLFKKNRVLKDYGGNDRVFIGEEFN